MTIDINELREAIQTFGSQAINEGDLNELLDRLEAAEKERDAMRATPQEFFDKLNAEFGFTLDVCATNENAKCESYYTKQDDGLAQPWRGNVWMNPPYGREIGRWMEKANEAAKEGATVVCLVPARTDTKWWHECAIQHEVRFIRGRLKFGDAKNSAPFPSAVIVMRSGVGHNA